MRYLLIAGVAALALLLAAGLPLHTNAQRNGHLETVLQRGIDRQPARLPESDITVRLTAGARASALAGLNAQRRATVVDSGSRSRLVQLRLPAGTDMPRAVDAYRHNPAVAEAGLTRYATVLDTPNDPGYPYQWNMQSHDGGMWADTAWGLATHHGQGVVVAVIDTGVAYEDYNTSLNGFPQSFKRAPDLAATSFVAPWNFVNNNGHANDDHGHGSHVTGTIAENTNNGLDMAGVAYSASIMPLKAMDYSGNGSDTDIIEAIYYAVDHGAKVISMSLGWPGTGSPDANGNVCTEIVGLGDALQYAYGHGVVVVAAAGNDGGTTVICPAAYPTVIAVGATRFDGTAAFYSNSGQAMDIAAPGGDPNVDQNGDGYPDGVLQETFCYDPSILLLLNLYGSFCSVFYEGTSMATPHVAGAVALLLGQDGSLTPDQTRSLLQSTARDEGAPGWDPVYGAGLLDAAGAVASLLGIPKPVPTPPPGLNAPSNLTASAVSSGRIDLAWTDNASIEDGYKIERSIDGGATFAQIATAAANATGYSDTKLAAGTTYTYRVRAYESFNNSDYSNTAAATTLPPPPAPTNLSATALSSARIALTWTDNSSTETSFRIERSTDGVNFAFIASVGQNVTSYTSGSLTASTTYTYRVRAYDGWSYSGYSNAASATTQPPPAAPTNLAAVTVSSSRIDLTWTDNATNEAGFKIERSTNGGATFQEITSVSGNKTSYSNTGLLAATTYTYRVRAFDLPNYSGYSNVASTTTQPAPAAPSGLTASALSTSRIDLKWTDNATNEAGFNVERSTDGVTFAVIASVGQSVTSYSNTNLPASTTYSYRVRAYDGPNYSGYSNVASATTQPAPAAPSGLTATALSTSRIDLTWTDNATNEAGFKIERSTGGVSFAIIASVGQNVTSYSNTNLPASTTYTYRVRAYEGPNYSAYSNTASATTQPPPAAPTNLAATAVSSYRINLTWADNATNEAGFKVERSTDGITFAVIATVGQNVTSYANTNLPGSTTYTYRVRAYEGPNYSAYSNTSTATTQPVPGAPTNLTATPVSTGRIDLSWTDNSTNEAGFRIERSTDGVNFSLLTIVGVDVTSFSNRYLTSGVTYTYRVRAYDGTNYSAYSNTAAATAP